MSCEDSSELPPGHNCFRYACKRTPTRNVPGEVDDTIVADVIIRRPPVQGRKEWIRIFRAVIKFRRAERCGTFVDRLGPRIRTTEEQSAAQTLREIHNHAVVRREVIPESRGNTAPVRIDSLR